MDKSQFSTKPLFLTAHGDRMRKPGSGHDLQVTRSFAINDYSRDTCRPDDLDHQAYGVFEHDDNILCGTRGKKKIKNISHTIR